MFTVLHIKAPYTTNGNPQRLFLVLKDGAILGAVDEGYEGDHALEAFKDGSKMRYAIAGDVEVQAKEYKRLPKDHSPKSNRFRLLAKR